MSKPDILVELQGEYTPESGCFSCDHRISKLITETAVDLPNSDRVQAAARRAGKAVCPSDCRDDCPQFNSLPEIVDTAVHDEREDLLERLEVELAEVTSRAILERTLARQEESSSIK